MKILCLHGGGTNATILQTQLAPVKYELAKTVRAELHFINGPNEARAATGIAEQFDGPYYRFFDSRAPYISQMTGVSEAFLRQAESPEDFGRGLREAGLEDAGLSRACDFLQQYVEQHDSDPFDGVLGFSEGATIAASLILRQCREKGSSLFKFAIFVCCTVPPLRSDREDILLADETAERIDIPTAHIVGYKDPGYQGGRALYNLCNQSSASIFDHGGTHTIPWDLASTRGISKTIGSVVERCQSMSVA
ncbi:serine hydrolase FSH [Usnea florida]